jgi:NAD(P)-dependent dehydrogenase (short-subunit alcohol dehydrogenase family)
MDVAVVSGASTGIGLATVDRLARDLSVVWAGVRAPERAELLDEVVANHPEGRVRPVRLDVDDDESVHDAFAQMRSEGEIDVLVNNAGVSGAGPVEEVPLDEFRRQMETNVFGVLRCTQAVVGSMRERAKGCIVNVGSLAGRFVRPSMGAYAASKHAVEALTEALAQELAPFGVRVAVVEPGVVATPIWTKSTPPQPDTAYPRAAEQALAYYAALLADPTPPQAVAEVIAQIVDGTRTEMRHPVGDDAVAVIAARSSVSDEDLVAMADLELDDWRAAWSARFGLEL